MKNYQVGLVGIMLLCLWGCFDINIVRNIIGDALEPIEDPDVSSVASANTRFGFKLLHDLREREPGGNIFISPLSISIALTMTYNGAVRRNRTRHGGVARDRCVRPIHD